MDGGLQQTAVVLFAPVTLALVSVAGEGYRGVRTFQDGWEVYR